MNRLATAVCVLLVGCKGSVKTDEVERWVKQRVAELGVEASKVTCPGHIDAKVGVSFECVLVIEGAPYTLVGKITKVESEMVNYDTAWKGAPNGVILRSKLVPSLTGDLTKRLKADVQVACPEPLLVLDAKRAVTCDVTAGATKAKLVVSFDEKLFATGWKFDPPLLSKAAIEQTLTSSVDKQVPGATVSCGSEPLFPPPADGVLVCEIASAGASAKIKVEIAADAQITRWETIQ